MTYVAQRLAEFQPAYRAIVRQRQQEARQRARALTPAQLAILQEVSRNRLRKGYSVPPKVLADKFGVNVATVYHWLKKFQVPHPTIEGRSLFCFLCKCVDLARRADRPVGGPRRGSAQRAQMVRRYAALGVSNKEIAKRFGMHSKSVWAITQGRRWA